MEPPPTVYYVDAANGNDSNDGTSTATPWKTLSKVRNSATPNNPYPAGTRVLLKRGETWREQLRFYANSTAGTASRRVTVGAYGTGAKPLILGSLNRSSASNWTETSAGSHIWWTTCGTKDIGNIVLNGGTSIGQKHFKSTSTLSPEGAAHGSGRLLLP